MPTNKERAAMEEELAARTQQNYQTKDGEKTFFGCFRRDVSFKQWYAAKGEHELDIIPYFAGAHDPKVKEGAFNYVVNYLAHRNVGPRDLWFMCLEQFEEKCPICEHRTKLRKDPPDGGKAKTEYEELLKALKPARRCVYNIVCYDEKQEEKGVQVWEVAHFLSENKIMERAKRPKKRGGGLIPFASVENGYTICFDREGEGMHTKYTSYDLAERDYEIGEEHLDAALTLDELLYKPTYEEIHDAFWDSDEQKDADEEEEEEPRRKKRKSAPVDDAEEEEEEPRMHKGRGKPKRNRDDEEEEEDEPRPKTKKCPAPGGTFGVDTDELDECEGCPLWNPCAKAALPRGDSTEDEEENLRSKKRRPKMTVDNEEEEEPRRKKRKSAPVDDAEEEEEPRRKKRKPTYVDDEEEEEPPPRKRKPAPVEEEEEEEPRPKRKARKVVDDEEEEEEEPAPRKRKPSRVVDDDEEEEEPPPRKRKPSRTVDDDIPF